MTMNQTARTDHEHTMERRLADAGAALDRIAATAKDLGGAVRGELQDVVGRLRSEREMLTQQLQELRATDEEAWGDYRERVDRARQRLEADVRIAEAELQRRLAESRKEFTDTVATELEAWQTRIDELRVQAELAKMDTQEDLEPIMQAMQRRRSDLERRLGELQDASEDTWQSIREEMVDSLTQLRHSLQEATQRMSS